MKFRFPIVIIDEDYRSENTSGLGIRALAQAIETEGFEVLGWFAVLVPARTPADVIKTLNTELNRMTTKPAVLTRLQELGAEPMGGTPEQAASYVRNEQEKWGRVIRDAGIKAN